MEIKSLFSERLNLIMKERGVTQSTLSKAVGITKQSISMYSNAHRVPDIEVFKNICEFFEVSADYLLGISDVKSFDLETKAIGEKLKLDDAAIEQLESIAEIKGTINGNNQIQIKKYAQEITIDVGVSSVEEILTSDTPDDIDLSLVLNAFISDNEFLRFFTDFTLYIHEKTLLMGYKEWAKKYVEELMAKDNVLIRGYLGKSIDLNKHALPENAKDMIANHYVDLMTEELFKNEKSSGDSEYLSFNFYRGVQNRIDGIINNFQEKVHDTKWYALHMEKLRSDFKCYLEVYIENANL